MTGKAIELKKEVATLESVVDNELGPLQTLYSVCSSSDNKPTAEALSKNLVNLFDRLAAVEHHCVAIATQPSSSLGSRPAPPLIRLGIQSWTLVKHNSLYLRFDWMI